ncbi:MAG: hypothetical protein ABIH99_01550 [Candidatus Micrarchaeota archaeon]
MAEEDINLDMEWDIKHVPYQPKYITLANGQKLVIREVQREEVPVLLESIHPLLTYHKDFYDIVSARMYAELLGWYTKRVRNEYALVGVVNGEIAGIVNNRLYDQKKCISFHTMALMRGIQAGAHLFAAKQEHAIENYGVDEILVTAESPIGFRRWMVTWALEPRPGVQHELGGVNSFALTKENYYKQKPKLVFGSRPVPEDLLKSTMNLKPVVPALLRQSSDE